MKNVLKLGVIGLSEGNGHPYSWSTIFNGYNPDEMKKSAFPNIVSYLKKQKFPEDQITDATISHAWTQDPAITQNIAESCNISNTPENYTDFIGEVDAILLARDDHENHHEISKPFLNAGLPIFIDKPLATSSQSANDIFDLQTYEGQIFTCSALRFAEELYPSPQELQEIGPITHIMGSTVKSWDKYAIHLIEPVINFLGFNSNISEIKTSKIGETVSVIAKWDNDIITEFQAMGHNVKKGPIRITYYGENGYVTKEFTDPFSAFKTALMHFVETVRSSTIAIPKTETLKVINIIEEGLK